MTIPAQAVERQQKLDRLQKQLEAAQDAASQANNSWDYARAQAAEAALQRRVVALYRRS